MAWSWFWSSSSQFHLAAVSDQILSFIFFLFYFNGALGVTVTIVNDCGFTVWPALSNPTLSNETAFELTKGRSRSFEVPDLWRSSILGRTGCNFKGSDIGYCVSGNCTTGENDCDALNPTPATRAYLLLNQTMGDDQYYVDLTDGYNLPILVEPTGGSGPGLLTCAKTGCANDLNQWCPTELNRSDGRVCLSPCYAFLSPEYCCSSFSYECQPNAYAPLYNSICPRIYNSAQKEWTGQFRCTNANYTVRFCPTPDSFSTIRLGGKLSSTDQLVSIYGNFTLGFFGKDYSYLGIWYTNDVQSRKVWVANPNEPIQSTSGAHALSINPNTGDLIITAGGRTLMSITNVQSGPNPNVTATLEESGNFRLISEFDKKVIWQSFDHPTNVLLPGMKLGYDMTIGKNWSLTSRMSNEIPHSGSFTMSWEPIEEASQRLH